MNTLILYDTQLGNIERIAQTIANALNAHGAVRMSRVDQAQCSDISGFDLLVLGCPTQQWRISPGMKAFLDIVPCQAVRSVAVACFDTRHGDVEWITNSAAKGIAHRVVQMRGAMLAPPESFIIVSRVGPLVEGEIDRAGKWAIDLHIRLQKTNVLMTA